MKNVCEIKWVAALLCGMVVANASALSVSTISQVTRPSSSTYGAEQISGITYAGGDLFYAVDDNDNKLYPLTLAINRSSGALTTSGITIGTGVTMSGGNDMEGCAYDPCSGKVWISQETSALIREYDPSTGDLARSAPVPAVQKKYRGNYSLEALTISGDGKTMWTANEEALTVDGLLATNSVGSIVRLTRFTRDITGNNWTANGEWAYETQPIGTAKDSHTRSGVSGLCALPDGTLLVLERRCYQGGLFPDFNIRIYQVNFSGATDVSSLSALQGTTYTKTTKTLLWQYTHGSDMPNYEGICLGPRLDDGSSTLVLVGDGGSSAEEGIFVLKLSGLSIRTFEFKEPSVGISSIVGKPYRFADGSTVNVELYGAQTPPIAYTNNNTVCTDVGWEVSGGQSPASGTGPQASFMVAADGVFNWKILSETIAHTSILANDSFEGYDVGTQGSDIPGWSGEDAEVVATNYSTAAGYPMANEAHTKVLNVDGELTRDYSSAETNANQKLDFMVAVRRAPGELTAPSGSNKFVVACDSNGCMNAMCKKPDGSTGWIALSNAQYANDDWVRVTLTFDYTSNADNRAFAKVELNGVQCDTENGRVSPTNLATGGPWYELLMVGEKQCISSFVASGMCKLDDVILTVEDAEPAAFADDGAEALAGNVSAAAIAAYVDGIAGGSVTTVTKPMVVSYLLNANTVLTTEENAILTITGINQNKDTGYWEITVSTSLNAADTGVGAVIDLNHINGALSVMATDDLVNPFEQVDSSKFSIAPLAPNSPDAVITVTDEDAKFLKATVR